MRRQRVRQQPSAWTKRHPLVVVCGWPRRSLTTRVEDSHSPMERDRLYQYLQLQVFSKEEMEHVFDAIAKFPSSHHHHGQGQEPQEESQQEHVGKTFDSDKSTNNNNMMTIDKQQIASFLLHRFDEMEQEVQQQQQQQHQHDKDQDLEPRDLEIRRDYAHQEATRFLKHFSTRTVSSTTTTRSIVSQQEFVDTLLEGATAVDMRRLWPITLSILLVGVSVGVVTPAMPFVVETLGLTPGQYGTVVSSFALAKMAGNLPFAILVERHGRKPYLTWSLAVIALGVGGMGAATSFEQLALCRLFTGAGVAALTTASQLTVTDVSTPLNRATSMSPIVSAFAAGAAVGPAIGGMLVDQVGLQSTFFMVGTSYLGVAGLNRFLLQETQRQPFFLPWRIPHPNNTTTTRTRVPTTTMPTTTIQKTQPQEPQEVFEQPKTAQDHDNTTTANTSLASASSQALAQWVPLFQNPKIRSIMIMNGFYWFALAGSQMTLLPLLLTNPTGLNMTASAVGQVYMGMSLVQVLTNPFMARYVVDRIGKAQAIAGGCAVIATSITCLPLVLAADQPYPLFVSTLAFWALGSSMLSTAPLAYISDLVPEHQRAQAIAMLRTGGDVGFLLGASCVGGMADVTGSLDLAMQSSGGLLSAATFWFVVRQTWLSSSSTTTTTTTRSSEEEDNPNNHHHHHHRDSTKGDKDRHDKNK